MIMLQSSGRHPFWTLDPHSQIKNGSRAKQYKQFI
jgi:hypothetical protein